MGVDLLGVLELRLNLLRQLFAQFNSDDAEGKERKEEKNDYNHIKLSLETNLGISSLRFRIVPTLLKHCFYFNL